MEFNIKPFTFSQTAIKLNVNVINISDDEATIYYELIKENGSIAESGNKTIPIEALAIISQRPISVAAMNALLAEWELELEDEE